MTLIYAKIVGYAVLKGMDLQLFGGGNDSEYYHAYAIGEAYNAVNFWPIVLRFFNDFGVYSREFISYFIFALNLILIPFLVHSVSVTRGSLSRQRNFLISYLVVAAYPTLFFFSLDIYRDLVMVMIFLLGLFFFKRITDAKIAPFSIILFLVCCFASFLFRPYLGAAMFMSYVLLIFFSKTSDYFKSWVVFYVLGLMLGQALGVFDAITAYRGEDGFYEGGATMGVGLHERDPITFLMLFFYSFIAQVFGFYFPNFLSIIVFFVESVPFAFILYYVLKNRIFMNSLCKYLVIFFIVYSTIWVIGNDNLGTAVRLRIPSYISIFICFLVISQRKKLFLSKNG